MTNYKYQISNKISNFKYQIPNIKGLVFGDFVLA